jgi:ParB family chromosome partitioning protein
MAKLDEVMRSLGGNINGSLGVGRTPGTLPPGIDPGAAQRAPAGREGVNRLKNALEIPTDKLRPDPDQPREEFDQEALERLAASLKARGQLQPVRVRWSEEDGCYLIISGERRWRAAVLAALPTLECVVHDGVPDPGERLAMQVVENTLREDLKPVEQAKAFRALMERNGWSGVRVAQELNITHSMVSQALALLKLPEDVQDQVDAGAIAARTAYELSKLPDAAEQRALAEQAAAGGLTLAQADAVVKARKAGKAKAEPGGRREIKFDDGARIVVNLPPGYDAGPAAVAEMLRRGLKKVQAELKQSGPGQAA